MYSKLHTDVRAPVTLPPSRIHLGSEPLSISGRCYYTYWYIITPFGWYKHVKIVCCKGSLFVIAHSRKKKLFLYNVECRR